MGVGINDVITPRSGQTRAQLSEMIERTLDKVNAAGAIPIYLGVVSTSGNPPDNTTDTATGNTTHITSDVSSYCTTQGWSCGSILTQMQNNLNWITDYYANLTSDVHPNNAGHDVIAKFAEYLYYTKNTMGTDKINIGSGARIYADGKFRNLGTVNSSTADLSVTPQTGLFNSSNKSYWLDITNITNWTTTHKAWTESNAAAGLTNTLHTIGDLEPNKQYYVKLDNVIGQNITGDNCANGVCTSNTSGEITFTYTGTYSYHTFDVEKIPDASSSGTTKAFRDRFLAEQKVLSQQITTTIVNPPTVTTTPLNLTRTLKYKMSGDDVKELQSYLNIHIYTNLTTDGKFGPLTKQAVIKFQQTNKLTPDGIVGPLTRGKMK